MRDGTGLGCEHVMTEVGMRVSEDVGEMSFMRLPPHSKKENENAPIENVLSMKI